MFRKVIHDVERETLQKLKVAEKTRKNDYASTGMSLFLRNGRLSVNNAMGLLAQIDRLSFWHECLWEAVELVDWRFGEIRTPGHQPMAGRRKLERDQQLAHPRIHLYLAVTGAGKKLAERLENQLPENADFPGWAIAQPLADWQAQAETAFPGSCRSCLLFGTAWAVFGGWSMPCGTMAMRSFPQSALESSANGWRSGSKVTHRSKGWLNNFLTLPRKNGCEPASAAESHQQRVAPLPGPSA